MLLKTRRIVPASMRSVGRPSAIGSWPKRDNWGIAKIEFFFNVWVEDTDLAWSRWDSCVFGVHQVFHLYTHPHIPCYYDVVDLALKSDIFRLQTSPAYSPEGSSCNENVEADLEAKEYWIHFCQRRGLALLVLPRIFLGGELRIGLPCRCRRQCLVSTKCIC